ncbi:tRNA pseudouridine(55) synthase TruB [Sphaerospermopsis aphanizomenoides BCCUSP55]|uniref:tRNA pseudouridine(55) synthase TruB n=1 Tax=Sphaerospermopsis aphanizomenoides TaxID=459663 RepID=UPI000AE64E9C|nr:tRNA pseudouridine(55) synthase TruB [Sphaerospermopsis aphanizomenoides]MBK1990654.1 tRNA pseudouridine(55) synthase TruB [Sphaerospermopsis aphanizomenoides BCCUSP55]
MQGFLNLNKPYGWTSHDCVARVRKLLRLKRVGHAGTLDPAATGVLPIAVGKATRLLQYLPGEKAYQATVRFGIRTTTDDLEGEVITSQPCPGLSLTDIKTALSQFIGKIEQIPPSYSAIQVDGKRLYDLARKGEIVQAPTRTVEVLNIEVLDWRNGDFPELDLAIACGAGTYIRAIARDLGAVLNTGGTLAALTRTESSGFHLQDSFTLTDLETQLQAGTFQPVAPDAALQKLPSVNLPETFAKKWCQGQQVPLNLDLLGLVRVYEQETRFLGIAQIQDQILIPQMVFEPIS